jgi:hypothetical protein
MKMQGPGNIKFKSVTSLHVLETVTHLAVEIFTNHEINGPSA